MPLVQGGTARLALFSVEWTPSNASRDTAPSFPGASTLFHSRAKLAVQNASEYERSSWARELESNRGVTAHHNAFTQLSTAGDTRVMFEPHSLIRTEGTLEPGLYWFLRTYMRSKKRGVNGTRKGIRPAERATPVLGARGPPAARVNDAQ